MELATVKDDEGQQTDRAAQHVVGKDMERVVTCEELCRPMLGPLHPDYSSAEQQEVIQSKNTLTGYTERIALDEFAFETQRRTFSSLGYAAHPSMAHEGGSVIGNKAAYEANKGATVMNKVPSATYKKRKTMGDPCNDTFLGPWAGYEGENLPYEPGGTFVAPEPAALAQLEIEKAKKTLLKHTRDSEYIAPGQERSIFHGKSERDYLGRTYMAVPNDVHCDLTREPGEQACYLPKNLLHTYKGHGKGVSAIRFLPSSGHLLLSASMDAKIKIWDVYHERKCLRTFIGHNKAVRDINFRSDGRQFLSAGYDKVIKLWDTETGACLQSYPVRATPYCVTFHPAPSSWHYFLAGCANKRIYQWDARVKDATDICQEYNQHLDAVNTITFIDDDKKFVSTSDDKSIRVWEFDIPVTVKNIAEPHMHSMPAVTLHPNKKYLLAQSMNNQLLTFSIAGESFRAHNKKFVGHCTAGYAVQPSVSPDGQYVMSGDADGKLWFWQWKNSKPIKSIQAHDKVTIGAIWHPQEPSKVATCSWDGTIKYWD